MTKSKSDPVPPAVQTIIAELASGDPFYDPLQIDTAGEGGYYAGTLSMTYGEYQGAGIASHDAGSGGYTILTDEEPLGAIHVIQGKEAFCFLGGDPVEMLQIDPDTGVATERTLGPGLGGIGQPTATIGRGRFQATRKHAGEHGFSLYWAVLVPAFDPSDTKQPTRAELVGRFPALEEVICRYTSAD